MASTGKQSRIDYSDAIRASASVAVVMLHVLFSDNWKDYSPAVWWFADILHAFVKPAVPLFVMISGAFLLDPRREFFPGKFWRGRIPRILMPYLAWCAVYACWNLFHTRDWPASELFERLLEGRIADHLWFVNMLLGLYLALPILRRFVAGAQGREIPYFLALWMCAITVASVFGADTAGSFVVATGFTGYFVGGYWLSIIRLPGGTRRLLPAAIVLVAVANAALAHRFASGAEGYFDEDYSILCDLGPTVAILSGLVFLYFRSLDYEHSALARGGVGAIVGSLSNAGYGLYLSHPIVLLTLDSGLIPSLRLNASTGSPWIGIPLYTAAGVVIPLALLYLLDRVPLLRILAPMGRRHEPRQPK